MRDPGGAGRLPAIGPRLDHVERVARGAKPAQLGVRPRAAALRDVSLLEHQQRRALAHDEAVAIRVERPRGAGRRVVVAGATARE